jgi:hypothetical protein
LSTLSALASTLGGIVSPIYFAGFEVDDEIKLCRLLDGEIGRLGAFKNFVDVRSGATE